MADWFFSVTLGGGIRLLRPDLDCRKSAQRSYLVGMGAAGCAYGIIGTLGLLFRGQKFFVFFGVIEGQYLAMILLAIGVILSITAPINLIWVSGAAVAYLYIKLCWRTAEVKRSGTVSTVRKKLGSFVDID